MDLFPRDRLTFFHLRPQSHLPGLFPVHKEQTFEYMADMKRVDQLSSNTYGAPPKLPDTRHSPSTEAHATEGDPRVCEIAHLLLETGISARNNKPSGSASRTDSEDKPNISNMSEEPSIGTDQQQSHDQDDIVRVCFDFDFGSEVDVDFKIRGEFAMSFL